MLNENRGFTIVELLIVIAILAILTTIGFVQYQGLNKKARDSARRADVHEITTALEVNKGQEGYKALQVSQFSSLQWVDPSGNVYCIASGTPADPSVSSAWGSSCPSGYVAVAPGAPATNFANWKVCSFLENAGSSGFGVFCKTSRQ